MARYRRPCRLEYETEDAYEEAVEAYEEYENDLIESARERYYEERLASG